jgi:hypothetical protein
MIECPNCGNNEQGKMLGHEVRGVYDGVLVWECLGCRHAWPRDFGSMERRNLAAREYADQLNARWPS